MARTVKHSKLESRTARARLKRGRQPHWRDILTGPVRVHIGYQRRPEEGEGRWLLRRYIGRDKYRVAALGRADDVREADGVAVLSFEEAAAKARALVDAPAAAVKRLTVRGALERYIKFKQSTGAPVQDVVSRGTAHILPALGDSVVSELTAEKLRTWLAALARSPAQSRPKAGRVKYRAEPKGDEAVRARRASANRVLTMLKAALNHAYDEGHVANRDAWGRKLKPFRDVEVARVRYLKVPEAQRLINACGADFRPLVRGALESGARYGELTRLEVQDFNADAGTLTIRRSKSGKARHVVLTPEGVEFFREYTAGRGGNELIFHRADGSPWKKSEQKRLMDDANDHAKLKPPITFHGLRHTWASLSVMAGVPLMVVAKNLGHTDTRMVEKHYAHLAPSYTAEAIRAGAPRFGIPSDKRVVPLR